MNRTKIMGIYLAAGSSSRMGIDKRALPLKNTTLGSMALTTALHSHLEHVIVVTELKDSLNWLDPTLWSNAMKKRWTHMPCAKSWKGQAHSIGCGLQIMESMEVGGAMILLADQPFISVQMINNLVFQYRYLLQDKQRFVAASFKGIMRPPILFSYKLFPALMALQGDSGARKLLDRYAGIKVEYDDEKNFFDIDTNQDYEQAKGEKFK